ncbi:MAG: hypothetical protein OK454_06870 [Thaumarchaeota archaeon]|nr:hypothetical protein [Nitrososphaerota archaeon]
MLLAGALALAPLLRAVRAALAALASLAAALLLTLSPLVLPVVRDAGVAAVVLDGQLVDIDPIGALAAVVDVLLRLRVLGVRVWVGRVARAVVLGPGGALDRRRAGLARGGLGRVFWRGWCCVSRRSGVQEVPMAGMA